MSSLWKSRYRMAAQPTGHLSSIVLFALLGPVAGIGVAFALLGLSALSLHTACRLHQCLLALLLGYAPGMIPCAGIGALYVYLANKEKPDLTSAKCRVLFATRAGAIAGIVQGLGYVMLALALMHGAGMWTAVGSALGALFLGIATGILQAWLAAALVGKRAIGMYATY